MNDYHAFIELSSSQMQQLLLESQLVWAVPGLLFVFGLWLLRPWFRRYRREARVRACIRRLGKTAMRDVSLDNGMEGMAFIDWLVLTDGEILAVTLQRGRGAVFGAEKTDSWARVVGRRTYRFNNPLMASDERVLAVKYHLPKVPVRGIVLFEEGASFPKGKPEGVLLPADVTGDRKQWEQVEIPAALQTAWDQLAELGTQGEQMYGRDLLVLRGRATPLREVLAVSLLMLALAVSMWRGWHLF
jgi:hypothetical protein